MTRVASTLFVSLWKYSPGELYEASRFDEREVLVESAASAISTGAGGSVHRSLTG